MLGQSRCATDVWPTPQMSSALALHSEQCRTADRAAVDQPTAVAERAFRQCMLLEDAIDAVQIKAPRQVHDRQKLFVEVVVLAHAVLVTLDQVLKQFDMRCRVAFQIHGHEAGELQKTG